MLYSYLCERGSFMAVKDWKRYRAKSEISYSFGTFPTLEMLKNRADAAEAVLMHPDLTAEPKEKLRQTCLEAGVPCLENAKAVERLRDKENCTVIGVFRKYTDSLLENTNHVVLVNPGDAGNLGTIIRSCVGFGIRDIAVIEPAADHFHPKVIRASMGSIFTARMMRFADFEVYRRVYGETRICYPFMLDGEHRLGTFSHPADIPFSLVFGNEASGLDARFRNIGRSVVIEHTDSIDSLNLALAAGIGLYEFSKENRCREDKR